MFKKIQSQDGITLIEMLVAVSIFAVTIVVLSNIFILILNGQRKAIASKNIQENIRYAFEMMAKEIRMAHVNQDQYNTKKCENMEAGRVYQSINSNTELLFKNYKDECVSYSLEDGRIKINRNGLDGYITSRQVQISDLKFLVTDDYKNRQSAVTLKMKIRAYVNKRYEEMNVQTSISSRYY